MTRQTLTISKPRVNLAALRRDLKDLARTANDMNFACPMQRNGYIAGALQARGHEAPKHFLVVDIATMVGVKVVDGVIFP